MGINSIIIYNGYKNSFYNHHKNRNVIPEIDILYIIVHVCIMSGKNTREIHNPKAYKIRQCTQGKSFTEQTSSAIFKYEHIK